MNSISKAIQSVCRPNGGQNTVSLHEPDFSGTKSWEYVKDCLDTGWVSSAGSWVSRFEELIADYTGSSHVVAVTNGTVALRLALHLVGVKPRDEVIMPSLSFVATANSAAHLGAYPHFVDIDSATLGICPLKLERHLQFIAKKQNNFWVNRFTNRRLAALLPVHIFGMPANILALKKISEKWCIPLVEDAAEALGSWYSSSHCGTFGEIGCLSFNGNKLITTGGGGALLINDSDLARTARHLSTTAKQPHAWEFVHDSVGWNDRLPNINAALGVAQLEILEDRLVAKKKIADLYKNAFKSLDNIEIISPPKGATSNNWLVAARLINMNSSEVTRLKTSILRDCHNNGLLIRPVWKPLHTLPMYHNNPKSSLLMTENQANCIFNLPSSPQLLSLHPH